MVTMMEMNDFVIKHADAKYFDADVRLYKKHFPNSRLIPELERAPDFQKKALDERILFELLNNQDSCIDCIWENRGFIRNNDGKIIPMDELKQAGDDKLPAEMKLLVLALLDADLQSLKHNELKKFVFGLGLDKNCKDHKKETYLTELNTFIIEYTASAITADMNIGSNGTEGAPVAGEQIPSVDGSQQLPPVDTGLSVDHLVVDESKGGSSESHSDQVIDIMNQEKQELTEKVEELEAEKEDLEYELEDVMAEKESLEEKLEATEAELTEAKKKEDQEQSIQE
ncbi:MAG TPA: hypothetical protein VFG54_12225 [Prolixibacteraceae bacterium]|nr:hypothetical protein [Prolixibacteraceae bacterium]